MSVQQPQARAPRYAIRLSAELRTAEFRVTGTTRDVSAGGLCVEIDRPIAEGTTLDITLFIVEDDIEVVGGRGLDLHAAVQWVAETDRGHALGLRFVDVPPAKLAALKHALAQLGDGT